ncbi:hypothetical protein TNCT_707231 [Trichonephila clavata]|uniref:Uncharacterized protein n=1 Tax=Trichonephila clavata TaxID=2740835 RepID=A0A8X6KR89_TRICU|nr:hypothetical protein TNCT_583261 [Trichonephila clavata]GFQ83784.1 hypothetical protein TNCT_557701 [Trichonephila clavata]GFR28930.1 hypothetical protein TNCT_290861 [Trichonephila clavata]GFR32669.1 hypothetical protein TNCT_707231 [Trichonephila clavata]
MSIYFAHANYFLHQGKPVPIELSIATLPKNGSDPQVLCITVNHDGFDSTPRDMRYNACKNARLRLVRPLPKSVPVDYLPYCVRGMVDPGGLIVVKSSKQQKMFKELGLVTVCLEMLPKFNTLGDGTFPNPMHDDLHEEGDVSHCTMLKSFQFAKYLQQFQKLQAEWKDKVSALRE